MHIQSTRRPEADRLRHQAGFHRTEEDLLRQLTPVVRAALDRGEPVAIALRPVTEAALGSVLRSTAGLVPLVRPDTSGAPSGQTLAAQRARELRELTAAAGPVTVVTEHWSRFDGADGVFWTELDAALNVALADLPVSLTCFFPELPLHQAVLDGARRNHPKLLVGGITHANPDHVAPHDVVRATPVPAPVLLGPPDVRRTFSAWELNHVRAVVGYELRAAGFGRDHAEDVVLAVNEIATNAVEHGASPAEIALWTDVNGVRGGVVVEVHDGGELGDPLPGLAVPHPTDLRGRGVWIARQLCDSLHVWQDTAGTHVRLHAVP